MQRIFKLIATLVMLLVVLAACGGGTTNNTTNTGPSSSGNPARANIKFYVITHGQASDPFWSVVKKGVDQAAHDMGVQAIYEAPPTFDMVAMSHLIDSAVAAHPDGLVVSIPDPNIDGILTLGPTGASPAIKALQDLNKLGKIKLATFDLSSDVLNAIKAGQMLFAIDQQQYEQGYLPIVFLTLYKTNLNTVANDIIQTGPGFVTSANVSQVIQLTAQGTR